MIALKGLGKTLNLVTFVLRMGDNRFEALDVGVRENVVWGISRDGFGVGRGGCQGRVPGGLVSGGEGVEGVSRTPDTPG